MAWYGDGAGNAIEENIPILDALSPCLHGH